MAWRAIQDTLPESESLAGVSDFAFRLYVNMLSRADSWGRLPGSNAKVKARCLPMRDCTLTQVGAAIDELVQAGRVQLYAKDGDWFVYLIDFDEHQPKDVLGRNGQRFGSRYPDPPPRDAARRRATPAESESESESEQPLAAATPTADSEDLEVSQVNTTPGRSRDELFDAVTAECGIDPGALTRRGRGALNGALKELREVGASPDEIVRRAAVYRQRYQVALTPSALAKHWASLGGGSPRTHPVGSRYGRGMTTRQILEVTQGLG